MGDHGDRGISGSKDRRPQLDRLNSDVAKGKIDLDLCETLNGDPAEGREPLRRLFKDGKVHVRRGPDGEFIAKTELLPLAIVLAESAIAGPAAPTRAAG